MQSVSSSSSRHAPALLVLSGKLRIISIKLISCLHVMRACRRTYSLWSQSWLNVIWVGTGSGWHALPHSPCTPPPPRPFSLSPFHSKPWLAARSKNKRMQFHIICVHVRDHRLQGTRRTLLNCHLLIDSCKQQNAWMHLDWPSTIAIPTACGHEWMNEWCIVTAHRHK